MVAAKRLRWKAEQPQGGYRFGQVRIQPDPAGGYQVQGYKRGNTTGAILDERFRELWQAEMVKEHLESVGYVILPIDQSDARSAIAELKARAAAPLRPTTIKPERDTNPLEPSLF